MVRGERIEPLVASPRPLSIFGGSLDLYLTDARSLKLSSGMVRGEGIEPPTHSV